MRADAALHDGTSWSPAQTVPRSVVEVAAVISTVTIAPGSTAPATLTVTFWRVRPRMQHAVAAGALDEHLGAAADPARGARRAPAACVSCDQALDALAPHVRAAPGPAGRRRPCPRAASTRT